jgi:hypothetical protein
MKAKSEVKSYLWFLSLVLPIVVHGADHQLSTLQEKFEVALRKLTAGATTLGFKTEKWGTPPVWGWKISIVKGSEKFYLVTKLRTEKIEPVESILVLFTANREVIEGKDRKEVAKEPLPVAIRLDPTTGDYIPNSLALQNDADKSDPVSKIKELPYNFLSLHGFTVQYVFNQGKFNRQGEKVIEFTGEQFDIEMEILRRIHAALKQQHWIHYWHADVQLNAQGMKSLADNRIEFRAKRTEDAFSKEKIAIVEQLFSKATLDKQPLRPNAEGKDEITSVNVLGAGVLYSLTGPVGQEKGSEVTEIK